jgi:hypothetical protein
MAFFERIRHGGLAVPILLYLGALYLIAPWGDFPLSDDWQYARTAKHFAESGQLVVDTPVAPALVGQVLLAAPLVRVAGFSHTHLRILTMVLAGALLLALGDLLRAGGVPPPSRAMALSLVALNPLFLFFATTFMTEIYGFLPAFLGAVVWFRDREAHPSGAYLSSKGCLFSALLVGLGFWTRQYALLVFPALTAATFAVALLGKDWRRLQATLLPLLAGSLVLLGSAVLYLLWARSAGNLRPEFTGHLSTTLDINKRAWTIETGVFVCYMTAFALPLLLLLVKRGWGWGGLVSGVVFAALGLVSFLRLQKVGSEFGAGEFLHRIFPFIGNILYNAGVGSVTLSDVYLLDLPLRPRWPASAWKGIGTFLLVANLLWGPVVVLGVRRLKRATEGLAAEILLFSAFFGLGSFVAAVQAYRIMVFDRYHFPAFLGLALALAILLGSGEASRPMSRGLFALTLVPLAVFAVAGLHDEFQWNGARWDLYQSAVGSGVPPPLIEAGYEVDGWTLFDFYNAGAEPKGCLGPCSCDAGWYCRDNSYTVAMNPRDGYRAIASRQPRYWLAKGPPLLLLERLAVR